MPLASLTSTLNALVAFEAKQSALQFSFSLQGTQASAAAVAAQQCPVKGVFSDALIQAQKVAATAGLTVGPVLALSNSQPETTEVFAFFSSTFILGRIGLSAAIVYGVEATSVTCSVVAKFGLSH